MRGIAKPQTTELALGWRAVPILSVAAMVAIVVTALALGSLGAPATGASEPPLRAYAKLGGLSGDAVTLSSDGSTALVGGEGSATVYVRLGNSWIAQARLEPVDGSSGDAFGCSVALSADGDTALVGAPGRKADSSTTATPSAAWLFTRSDGTWVQQATLRPPSEAGAAEPLGCGAGSFGDSKGFGGGFGSTVALSGNGSVVLVGAPGADRYTGGVWAYTRSGSTWSQDGPRLLAPEVTIGALFGASVALSADGDTALIGAPADVPRRCRSTGAYAGGAWRFTRATGVWAQSGTRLAPSHACEGSFGQSIALSSDADTALISDAGRVLPFVRSGSSWSRQGSPLSCLDADCGALYGFSLSLALSDGGNVALVGTTPRHNCGRHMYTLCGPHGLALAFNRFGTTWVQQRPAFEGSTSFGSGVALSGSGESGLIGEPGGADAYSIPQPLPNNFSAGELSTTHSGAIDQQIAGSTAGTFVTSVTASAKELGLAHDSHHALIDYGRGMARVAGPGIVTVKIKPTPRVRRALARHRSISPKAYVTVRFKPHAGAAPSPQTFTVYLDRG
ncbi:MAG TPA: hypothetical protein VFW38_07375 [Solirubrobacteraceae bacterium]|nr:hypothetical protein [Solirubrobacteraceae bacterium]